MNPTSLNKYVVQQTEYNQWAVGRMTAFGFEEEQTFYTEIAAQRRCDYLNQALGNK